MTTSAITPTLSTRSGLTFGGILRSEWIKLTTLRSTIWCYIILVALNVGLGLLVATLSDAGEGVAQAGQTAQNDIAVQWATPAIGFSVLVAAVLGALVITGEYGTGMIRSTLTAVPRRTPALVAKAVVFGITTFVIGLLSLVITMFASAALLTAKGIHPDYAAPEIWLALIGAAGYLALVGVLSLGIGAIVRNSAGGIATSLGLILVLPTVLIVLAGLTRSQWIFDTSRYLPSDAGQAMYANHAGGDALLPWQGTLVLLAWAVVLFVIGAILLKRRDA